MSLCFPPCWWNLQVNNPKKQILSSLIMLTSSEVWLHNCSSFHRSLTPLGLIELIRMPNYRVIPALHRVQQKSSFPKRHTQFEVFHLSSNWILKWMWQKLKRLIKQRTASVQINKLSCDGFCTFPDVTLSLFAVTKHFRSHFGGKSNYLKLFNIYKVLTLYFMSFTTPCVQCSG